VNLPEELDAGNLPVHFYEGPGSTDIRLRSSGIAGKPGGKQRKQTSTYRIGRNRSTRLKSAFERCLSVLQVMGRNIRHPGELGSGMSMRLINNLLGAVNGLAVAQAMTLGKKTSLDPQAILGIITKSAGDSSMFWNRARQMVSGDLICRWSLIFW